MDHHSSAALYTPSSQHEALSLQNLHLSPIHHQHQHQHQHHQHHHHHSHHSHQAIHDAPSEAPRYRMAIHHGHTPSYDMGDHSPGYHPSLHRLQTGPSIHGYQDTTYSPHHGSIDRGSSSHIQSPHHRQDVSSASPIQAPFSSILTSNVIHSTHAMSSLPPDDDVFTSPSSQMAPSSAGGESSVERRPHGQLVHRIVPDPPDLDAWRAKLFHVDETIILSNDQFETYFPHIDNVYSHRSTQKYKRKPFVSHYWDCRMKGRPPGTPKSNDPSKKKRKRHARERDLCDVKIKITEYFPGASLQLDDGSAFEAATTSPGGGVYPSPSLQHLTPPGEKFWTIQRVNGNGGNGKGDGVAGPHKHSLSKSDEIKKSTVQRYLVAQEKEAKKSRKSMLSSSSSGSGGTRKTTGTAHSTAKKHSKDHALKLYAASWCPFSQRVWIALELKGLGYQYCETDPFKKPNNLLLEANPRGLVPAVREGEWATGESAVILEYLEEYNPQVPLYPTDPRLKANCRLWIDFINSKIVPEFFVLVKALDFTSQTESIERLQGDVTALVQAADERGPFFLGGDLCLVDIHFAPFVLRMSRVLREFRHWADPMPGTRWHQWVDALERHPCIRATTSGDELYMDTFEIFLTTNQSYGEF